MPVLSIGEQLVGIIRQDRARSALQTQVAQLFEDCREDVYRYLLTLGLYPPRAQEATQEVFLRLYTSLKKGEDIQNPRGWIFRVAHNYGLKLRERQASEAAFDPELESRLVSNAIDPERDLLERERMRRFHRAGHAGHPGIADAARHYRRRGIAARPDRAPRRRRSSRRHRWRRHRQCLCAQDGRLRPRWRGRARAGPVGVHRRRACGTRRARGTRREP